MQFNDKNINIYVARGITINIVIVSNESKKIKFRK